MVMVMMIMIIIIINYHHHRQHQHNRAVETFSTRFQQYFAHNLLKMFWIFILYSSSKIILHFFQNSYLFYISIHVLFTYQVIVFVLLTSSLALKLINLGRSSTVVTVSL
jgi:hypothetical protein